MHTGKRGAHGAERERYSGFNTEQLEELIGGLITGDNPDLELLDELLEIYGGREGVPEIDVGAAWERFIRGYSGQGEIYPF